MKKVVRIKWIILSIVFCFISNCASLNIAVLGAGPSGIISAKHSIDQGHNVTIFEKTGTLGGIWYYTEETGEDEYGVKIHTPMYRDLTTNLAKRRMQFPSSNDVKYPYDTPAFPSHEAVWKYLDTFARESNVENLIRYHNFVNKVVLKKSGKWQVTVLRKNLPKNKQKETHVFDAVFVCTGINFEPKIPKIDGIDKFKGETLHSRDYRKPETFIGETVLVIGKGPSGYDITEQLRNINISVILSSYKPVSLSKKILVHAVTLCTSKNFHDDCEMAKCNSVAGSGDVKRFVGKNGVEFQCGPCINITKVIYATGYKYSYPFLDKSAGIIVKDNYVEPLYMHVVNTQHPTMAFIGVAYGGISFQMYDLQAQFALKFMTGAKSLPPKKEMQENFKKMALSAKPHLLARDADDYYSILEKGANY